MEQVRSGYFEQTDHISCGPIATLNAEIWLGKSVGKSVIDTIRNKNEEWSVLGPRRKLCNTKYNNYPYRGTLWEDMSRALSRLGIVYASTTDINCIKSSLESGYGIILLYQKPNNYQNPNNYQKTNEYHYIFVYADGNRTYTINGDQKYYTRWDTFERSCLSSLSNSKNNYSRAWIIG